MAKTIDQIIEQERKEASVMTKTAAILELHAQGKTAEAMQEVASIPVEELAKYPDSEIEKLSALVNQTPTKPVEPTQKTAQEQTLPPKEEVPAGIPEATGSTPATEIVQEGDAGKPPMETPTQPSTVQKTVSAWVGDAAALPKEVQEKIGSYLKEYQEGIKIGAAQLGALIVKQAKTNVEDVNKEAEFNAAYDALVVKAGADMASQLALGAYLEGLNEAKAALEANQIS